MLVDLLAPFRKEDREESMQLIRAAGMDHLHMAFFQQSDVGSDKVWDNWQLEGRRWSGTSAAIRTSTSGHTSARMRKFRR